MYEIDVRRLSADLVEAVVTTRDTVAGTAGVVLEHVAVGIAMKTAVVTGRARGGVQTTLDAPSLSDNGRLDPSGTAVAAQARAAGKTMKFGQDGYVTDVVPYFSILNDGGENRPPRKMVESAVDEVVGTFTIGGG